MDGAINLFLIKPETLIDTTDKLLFDIRQQFEELLLMSRGTCMPAPEECEETPICEQLPEECEKKPVSLKKNKKG